MEESLKRGVLGRQPTSMKRPKMATFKQQNVEDFYEMGEVLGR